MTSFCRYCTFHINIKRQYICNVLAFRTYEEKNTKVHAYGERELTSVLLVIIKKQRPNKEHMANYLRETGNIKVAPITVSVKLLRFTQPATTISNQ